VWSTVSVLKADTPASYPGKHSHFVLSMVLQSPYTLLIGSVPSQEDSFYRCALHGSRIAISTPHLYCSSTHTMGLYCTFMDQSSQALPSPLYLTRNSPVSTVISAHNYKTRFFLNYIVLKETRFLSSFKDRVETSESIPSTVYPWTLQYLTSLQHLSFRKLIQDWSARASGNRRGEVAHFFGGEGRRRVLHFSHRTAHAYFQ